MIKRISTIRSLAIPFLAIALAPISAKAASLNDGMQKIFKAGPEANLETFRTSVLEVIDWGMNAAGVIVILSILYAAILYLTAQGDETKAETAKKVIIYVAVGAIFVSLAKTILLIIEKKINTPL